MAVLAIHTKKVEFLKCTQSLTFGPAAEMFRLMVVKSRFYEVLPFDECVVYFVENV